MPFNIMQINFRNNYKHIQIKQKVSFDGLTRMLKNRAYGNSNDIYDLFEKSNSDGIAGTLPLEWISLIPEKNRGEMIKTFYKDFREVVNEVSDNYLFYDQSKLLTNAFRKIKLLQEDEIAKLSYLDDGSYGDVFLIKSDSELLNDKYVVKIFKNGAARSTVGGHGFYSEINRGLFLKKQSPDGTGIAPVYWGDSNSKRKYFVEKYIPKDASFPKYTLDSKPYGLYVNEAESFDEGRNMIRGFCIDYGGILINDKNLAQSKDARYFYKKLSKIEANKRFELATKIVENNCSKNYDDNIKNLLSAVFLLENEEQAQIFLALAKNNVGQLHLYLTEHKYDFLESISGLPKGSRGDFVKDFVALDDISINRALLDGLIDFRLSADDKKDIFLRMMKQEDPKLNFLLIHEARMLPKMQKKEVIDNLRALNNSAINRKLDHLAAFDQHQKQFQDRRKMRFKTRPRQ